MEEEKLGEFSSRHCKPCEGGASPLSSQEAERYLTGISGWQQAQGVIGKTFEFKDYCRTMAFANAVAWIAHSEGHHPDLEISYRSCRVKYTTHAIGGLSENDFICAARVDALLA